MPAELVELKLHAAQLKPGDRLISDDGTPGQLVTQVTSRRGETTVSHPTGHTTLIGDPPLRVLRRTPRADDPAGTSEAPRTTTPEQPRKPDGPSGESGHQQQRRPAPAPVFLAAEHPPHQ